MRTRDELMTEISLISRQLQTSDEPTPDLIEALVDSARAINLPVDERREDTHRFIEGDESVESATWAQCAGLVHALQEGQVVDDRALAARVAQRIFDLLPTHY
jgi:hypothetical protein